MPLIPFLRGLGKPAKAKLDPASHFFQHRWVRAVTVMLSFVYFNITAMGISAVYCIDVNGTMVLEADRTVVCYQGEHIPVAVIGWMMLAGVTVLFPIVTVVVMFTQRNDLMRDVVYRRWGFMYESYKIGHWHTRYFSQYGFILAVFMAVANGLYQTERAAQMSMVLASNAVYILALIVLRPCVDKFEEWLTVVCTAISMTEGIINYVGSDNFVDDPVAATARHVVGILILGMRYYVDSHYPQFF